MGARMAVFKVYRRDYSPLLGVRAGKRGVMIGAIQAKVRENKPSACFGGDKATHILTESLFTIARPGDVLISGASSYDVIDVKDASGTDICSDIYVRKRGEGT